MKKMVILFATLGLSFNSLCAEIHNMDSFRAATQVDSIVKFPSLEIEVTSEVGDSIISTAAKSQKPVLNLFHDIDDVKIGVLWASYSVKLGKGKLPFFGISKEGGTYYVDPNAIFNATSSTSSGGIYIPTDKTQPVEVCIRDSILFCAKMESLLEGKDFEIGSADFMVQQVLLGS